MVNRETVRGIARSLGRNKKGRSAGLLLCAATAVAGALASTAIAGTQTWDPGGSTTGSDAAGNWDTSTMNWASGGADSIWTNDGTSTAVFGSGGAGGNVALNIANINAAGITFNTTSNPTVGYSIIEPAPAPSPLNTLTLSSPTVTVAASQFATINVPILGSSGLTVIGGGTGSTLKFTANAGKSTFTGNVLIQSGTKVIANGASTFSPATSPEFVTTSSFGTVSSTDPTLNPTITISKGATLDLGNTGGGNAVAFGRRKIFVAGTGVDGTGAIVNSASGASNFRELDAFQYLTLTDDTTVSGGRMDIGRMGTGVATDALDTLDLAGHTLTISMTTASTQPMFGIEALNGNTGDKSNAAGTMVTAGNIDVTSGSLDIETTAQVASDASSTITFEKVPNTVTNNNLHANLELFNNNGIGLTRALIFKGNNFIGSGANAIGAPATLASNITLQGNISFETDVSGVVQDGLGQVVVKGNIVESAGAGASVTQVDRGITTLSGVNNWTGGTFVLEGILTLGCDRPADRNRAYAGKYQRQRAQQCEWRAGSRRIQRNRRRPGLGHRWVAHGRRKQ